MVIPAGQNPDQMMQNQKEEQKFQKKRPQKLQGQIKQIYPNREIPTPDPVPGRLHMEVQTEKYEELLQDKPEEREQCVITEFYLDRPPVPLFQPKMPLKDDCKFTQTYEDDYELFNFDMEIEPMLNVLVQRTLEQAQMQVHEEEEIRIMNAQRKQYQEIRNAELIEAQRLEASDLRRKQELERRKIQQKARKEEKRWTHKKYLGRVMAKKHLIGLKENALMTLVDQGVLVPPIVQVLQLDVYPWMLGNMMEFINQESRVIDVNEDILANSFSNSLFVHRESIRKEYKRREEVQKEKERQIQEKELFRQNRRLQREQRRKMEELQQLKQQITKIIIEKGESKDHVTSIEVLEINGNYEKQKPFIGAVGGQVMQLCLPLQAINHVCQQENFIQSYEERKIQKNPIEILKNPQLMQFMMQYIKDMKLENFIVLISQQTMQLIENFKVQLNELHKLTDEQVNELKQSFLEQPGHQVFNLIRDANLKVNNFSPDILNLVLSNIIDIVCKRIPQDISMNQSKIDSVANKIKLVAVPKWVVEYSQEQQVQKQLEDGQIVTETVQLEKNTNERALVRVKIPLKKVEEEVDTQQQNEDGTQIMQKIEKIVEIDQDDKVLLINARTDQLPYSVFVMNQYGPRIHRRDLFIYLKKNYGEYLDSKEPMADLDKIIEKCEEISTNLDDKLVEMVCPNDDIMPLFEFDINLNENDQ